MPNSNGSHRPTKEALAFILAGLALILGAVLVLYALTEPARRPDLLTRLGQTLPSLVLLAPVILAWLNGREANAKADRAAKVAERVEHKVDEVVENVNGHMADLVEKVDPPRAGGT